MYKDFCCHSLSYLPQTSFSLYQIFLPLNFCASTSLHVLSHLLAAFISENVCVGRWSAHNPAGIKQSRCSLCFAVTTPLPIASDCRLNYWLWIHPFGIYLLHWPCEFFSDGHLSNLSSSGSSGALKQWTFRRRFGDMALILTGVKYGIFSLVRALSLLPSPCFSSFFSFSSLTLKMLLSSRLICLTSL